MTKNCGWCGKSFILSSPRHTYCSYECKRAVKLAGKKKYRENNKEQTLAGTLRWKRANRDKVHEMDARDRANHPDRNKLWRESNPDLKREIDSAWKKSNPEKVARNHRNRRAMKAMVQSLPYTRAEVLAKCDCNCYLCWLPIDVNADGRWDKLAFSIDHVVAIVMRGDDVLENAMPAHRSCNSSKGSRKLDELSEDWYFTRKKLMEPLCRIRGLISRGDVENAV